MTLKGGLRVWRSSSDLGTMEGIKERPKSFLNIKTLLKAYFPNGCENYKFAERSKSSENLQSLDDNPDLCFNYYTGIGPAKDFTENKGSSKLEDIHLEDDDNEEFLLSVSKMREAFQSFNGQSKTNSQDRQERALPGLCSVVISDHSNNNSIEDEDEVLRFASFSLEDALRPRRFSTCSTCSTFSSCSLEEDSPPMKPEKVSGWRKLRNVVHWSPFVQTYKKNKYPWVQLAGHQGNFKSGSPGNILKKLNGREDICLAELMTEPALRPFVPLYHGKVTCDDVCYLELQDLLANFVNPCVMDIKMGIRTYLEDELARAREKPKLRKDMYEKMVQVDPLAPTEEEHRLRAITKPRYMVWRETISSTASLGFRIEGVKLSDGTSTKDFKTTKNWDQVYDMMKSFTEGYPHSPLQYFRRLQALREALVKSRFFYRHEMIGSSLLFVHDQDSANVWMIDFAKTLPVERPLRHDIGWALGSHEDGYLLGLDNLILMFRQLSQL